MADVGPPNEVKLLQIGTDNWIQFYTGLNCEELGVIGLIEWHKDKQGEWCAGSVLFDFAPASLKKRTGGTEYPTWHVVSRVPLSLTPSILCNSCGMHGYITNGLWVNC